METGIVIALVLAVFVGISVGLFGGGGSILAVPILTYVAGVDPTAAIASSLFIVGVTAFVGMLSHARAGRVRWKVGFIFGIPAVAGAYTGGFLGRFVPGTVLLALLAIMMVATATAMIRGAQRAGGDEPQERTTLPIVRLSIDGFVVGAVTGLVGAGGGFLIVPALNILGGLPMAAAVGTSLLIMGMKSFSGLSAYLLTVQLDWPLLLGFTAIAVVGSFIGSALAGKIPGNSLRKAFGYFVLAMGAFMLVKEAPQVLSLFADR